MHQFYLFSGLQLNNTKCELFFSGIGTASLLKIHEPTDFKVGTLPVRYIGVPLETRRLTDRDCAPLMDKFIASINH